MLEKKNKNQYADLKFRGNWIARLFKRIKLNLFSRPHRQILGVDTYVQRPFYCSTTDNVSIGERSTIRANLRIQSIKQWYEQYFFPKVTIGNDVYIGSNCEIVSIAGVHIGNKCTLSDNVYINDSSHVINPDEGLLMDRPLVTKGPVLIGDGCFIGRGAMIFSGVEIGENSVIGAGSIVRQSVPPFSMVAGSPSKLLAKYDINEKKWKRIVNTT